MASLGVQQTKPTSQTRLLLRHTRQDQAVEYSLTLFIHTPRPASPQRSQAMQLCDLPAEVFDKILDVLAAHHDRDVWKRSLAQLALVHRDHLAQCRRKLFSSIDLRKKEQGTQKRPAGYICRTSYAEAASYISHLDISLAWAFKSKGEWCWPVKEDKILLRIIESCSNLKSITLTWPGGIFPHERLENWVKGLDKRGFRAELQDVRSNNRFDPVLRRRAPQEWTVNLGSEVRGEGIGEIVHSTRGR